MLKNRFTEHWRPSTRTTVSQHLHLQGRHKHKVSLDSVRILDGSWSRQWHERHEGVCVHMNAPPRLEQGQRLPPAIPHLEPHSPCLQWPVVAGWRVTVPTLLNHTKAFITRALRTNWKLSTNIYGMNAHNFSPQCYSATAWALSQITFSNTSIQSKKGIYAAILYLASI